MTGRLISQKKEKEGCGKPYGEEVMEQLWECFSTEIEVAFFKKEGLFDFILFFYFLWHYYTMLCLRNRFTIPC